MTFTSVLRLVAACSRARSVRHAAHRLLASASSPRRSRSSPSSTSRYDVVPRRASPAAVAAVPPACATRRRGRPSPRRRRTWRRSGTTCARPGASPARAWAVTHFSTQFSGTVLALLWGYPFLVQGEDRSPGEAGALLTVLVLAAVAIGPVLGQLAGRWPYRRSIPTLTVVGASALTWTVVLTWPGPAPLALRRARARPGHERPRVDDRLRLRAHARTSPARLGSATRIVNVGGFVASLVHDPPHRARPELGAPGRLRPLHARRLPRRDVRAVRGVGDRARGRAHHAAATAGAARADLTRSRARSRRGRATGASDGRRPATDWTIVAASTMLTAQVRARGGP